MTDVHDKVTRSYNMSQIKGKNTKPEMLVRKFLFSKGFRYRIHDKKLPGKPDIVLPKYKTVIFVNGCFWHGHYKCKYFTLPKTRAEWWKEKIEKNIENDFFKQTQLKSIGYNVLIVWECKIKNKEFYNTIIDDIRRK
jgi:DNA mismatch endonuclease, patch repair protein